MLFKKNKRGALFLPLILPLMILLIVGLPFIWAVVKFMTSPVVSGSIPVWVIIIIGFGALYVYKNRYRWGLVKNRLPPQQRYY